MRILYLSDDVDFLKILDKIKIEIIYDENIDYDISIIDIDQWNDNEYLQIDWRKYKKPIALCSINNIHRIHNAFCDFFLKPSILPIINKRLNLIYTNKEEIKYNIFLRENMQIINQINMTFPNIYKKTSRIEWNLYYEDMCNDFSYEKFHILYSLTKKYLYMNVIINLNINMYNLEEARQIAIIIIAVLRMHTIEKEGTLIINYKEIENSHLKNLVFSLPHADLWRNNTITNIFLKSFKPIIYNESVTFIIKSNNEKI